MQSYCRLHLKVQLVAALNKLALRIPVTTLWMSREMEAIWCCAGQANTTIYCLANRQQKGLQLQAEYQCTQSEARNNGSGLRVAPKNITNKTDHDSPLTHYGYNSCKERKEGLPACITPARWYNNTAQQPLITLCVQLDYYGFMRVVLKKDWLMGWAGRLLASNEEERRRSHPKVGETGRHRGWAVCGGADRSGNPSRWADDSFSNPIDRKRHSTTVKHEYF